MTLGVIDILERGEWLAQVKRAEELVSLSVFEDIRRGTIFAILGAKKLNAS